MERALRAGEPVLLELATPPPPDTRLDDIVPLCHAVHAWQPDITRALESLLPPPAKPGCGATVTVIIPTHRQTPIGLSVLRSQDVQTEVLVLANGEMAADTSRVDGDHVVAVPWDGHGRTRQRGVELADGEYIFFSVDDALPLGAGFLRTLVEALEEGSYDAVFARQVPWPTSNPVAAQRLRLWTPPGQGHRPLGRHDHVAALYRRETLLKHPLPPVPIAEDLHWARGKRTGYVPRAPVVHCHPRSPIALYQRNVAIHAEHLRLGDPPEVKDLAVLLAAIPGIALPVLQGGLLEILNQGAEIMGQYVAARRHRRSG